LTSTPLSHTHALSRLPLSLFVSPLFCHCIPVHSLSFFFFFNATATTEIYTLSLHDALPISLRWRGCCRSGRSRGQQRPWSCCSRSEEHTSELQSPCNLVCRLLLEKKKKNR